MSDQANELEARGAADFLFSLMEQAWNGTDVEAYAQLYSYDAGYINRYGSLVESRTEIARLHTDAFAGRFRNTRLRIVTRRFRLLAPTVALAHVEVITHADGPGADENAAIATIVLTKDHPDWRIAALHVSEIAAAD